MWYVIQVMSGAERKTLELSRGTDRSIAVLGDIPAGEVMKRYHGAWHKEQQRMFLGYLFVVTADVEVLGLGFYKVLRLTKVLGSEWMWIVLSEDEVRLMQHIMNSEYVAEVLRGILVMNSV